MSEDLSDSGSSPLSFSLSELSLSELSLSLPEIDATLHASVEAEDLFPSRLILLLLQPAVETETTEGNDRRCFGFGGERAAVEAVCAASNDNDLAYKFGRDAAAVVESAAAACATERDPELRRFGEEVVELSSAAASASRIFRILPLTSRYELGVISRTHKPSPVQ
jgi:hypothetical protein